MNGQPFFSRKGSDFFITGANIHIVNGLGATNGNPADPLSDNTTVDKQHEGAAFTQCVGKLVR